LNETYDDLVRSVESEWTDFSSTHIVFGASTSGSLKMAIQENVICFDDIFQSHQFQNYMRKRGLRSVMSGSMVI